MASAQMPVTNTEAGYTVVTQVIPTSTAQSTAEQNCPQRPSQLQKFLKGEPNALGAIQIINGLWMLLINLVKITPYFEWYGLVFWNSVLHIISGSLTVSASKKLGPCLVKGAATLNILSAICTGISIMLFSQNIMYSQSYYFGSFGILLVFSLLQFAIAISVSVFACKATRSNQPTLNVVQIVPNPAHHAYPGTSTSNAVSMNSMPVGCPPPYSEMKRVSEDSHLFM